MTVRSEDRSAIRTVKVQKAHFRGANGKRDVLAFCPPMLARWRDSIPACELTGSRVVLHATSASSSKGTVLLRRAQNTMRLLRSAARWVSTSWGKGALLLVALAIVGGVVLRRLDTVAAERERRDANVTQTEYAKNAGEFRALIQSWREVYAGTNECGVPKPGLGTVVFRRFQLNGDGSVDLASDSNDHRATSPEAAARALGVPREIVDQLTERLRHLSRSSILQQDAAVLIPNGENDLHGLAYVPPECPQFKNYVFASGRGSGEGFSALKELGGGWFYYVDKR